MLLEVSLPLEGDTLTRESAGGMSARPPREPPINEIIKRILQLQPLHTPENTPPMQQRASSREILDDGVGATALPLRFGMTIHVDTVSTPDTLEPDTQGESSALCK